MQKNLLLLETRFAIYKYY